MLFFHDERTRNRSLKSLSSFHSFLLGLVVQVLVLMSSDLIIPGLDTNRTAKIRYLGLILALFYSIMVIKNEVVINCF